MSGHSDELDFVDRVLSCADRLNLLIPLIIARDDLSEIEGYDLSFYQAHLLDLVVEQLQSVSADLRSRANSFMDFIHSSNSE